MRLQHSRCRPTVKPSKLYCHLIVVVILLLIQSSKFRNVVAIRLSRDSNPADDVILCPACDFVLYSLCHVSLCLSLGVAFYWTSDVLYPAGDVILIPPGGDVFLYNARGHTGRLQQISRL